MSGAAGLRTTCPCCGIGCGLTVAPDGTIAGDAEHPANRGLLCSKGAALAETLDDAGRLLYPEIGGVRAGWDEALDLVGGMFARTIDAHGPGSVPMSSLPGWSSSTRGAPRPAISPTCISRSAPASRRSNCSTRCATAGSRRCGCSVRTRP